MTEVDLRARVEVVRAAIDAGDRGDIEAALAFCHPDVEFLPLSASRVEGRSYRGHNAVRVWQREREETWELRMTVEEVELIGERALALGQIHTRGKLSGVETSIACGWVIDFRDEKIARLETFADPADARMAAEHPPD